MNIQHRVVLNDAFGVVLIPSLPILSGEYVRAENEIGHLSITVPGYIPADMFRWHGRIEIWRSINGMPEILVEDTVWLISKVTRNHSPKESTWEIEADDLNVLWTYRIVDYNQNNAYTLKLDNADDLGKAVIRENLGSSATDTSRSIATYLTVDADTGAGPTVKKAFENSNVGDVLRDLAQASLQAGTYLVFDIISTTPPTGFTFKSYIGYRGVDHRFPSGLGGPLIIGPDFGNLTDAKLVTDYSDSWTRGIVSGDNTAGVFSKSRQNNTAMQALSPFGLIESYRSTQNQIADSTLLDSEAYALVREGAPRVQVSGSILNTPSFIYGLHWNWGDYLTVQAYGYSYDMHVQKVRVPIIPEPNTTQSVEVVMRST